MTDPSDIVAELKGVTKAFKFGEDQIFALNNISYTLHKSEFAVLAGPSGSGKSTFLNVLGCLDKPSKGELFIEGENITDKPLERLYDLRLHKMGFIFQSFNLVPVLSAWENVELPLLFKYENQTTIREKVEKALVDVGLQDRMHHKPGQLSGGQRQRVAIARALADTPSLLLADEPTANLDLSTSLSIINLLQKLNQEYGVTTVVASHDPDIIERANKVNYIRDGVIA